MTGAELATLSPWFKVGERFLNGKRIDWSTINYRTMYWVVSLRKHLNTPIVLIRGAHPNRPEAVDGCCPEIGLGQVFMGLTRIQECSWGIYSGASWHIDTRAHKGFPARWMAVKPREVYLLHDMKMDDIISNHEDLDDGIAEWAYLKFDHPRAWEALELVVALAENRKTTMV